MSDFGPRGDYGRVRQRPYRQGGSDRERRLQTTMAVGALLLLLVGLVIGFSIGRATAPRTPAPAVVQTPTQQTTTAETTTTVESSGTVDSGVTTDTSSSVDVTPAVTRPPRPRQLSPANGAVINAARVNLSWTKVSDGSGTAVTYTFELQNRRSGGLYGNTQTIKRIKNRFYSVRVLSVRRRWRVWAVSADGTKSKMSPWRTYIRKYIPPTTPKKSTTSSSTAQ